MDMRIRKSWKNNFGVKWHYEQIFTSVQRKSIDRANLNQLYITGTNYPEEPQVPIYLTTTKNLFLRVMYSTEHFMIVLDLLLRRVGGEFRSTTLLHDHALSYSSKYDQRLSHEKGSRKSTI
jgi:hypothetical protein